MSSAIQNILDVTLGDVARSTKYEAFFAFTDVKSEINHKDLIAMCKSATFPGKSHRTIDFKYKGRNIPIKGQTKYSQTWECTFYVTEDHKLKNAFENWIEALDQKHNYIDVTENETVSRLQKAHVSRYFTDLFIYQRNFDDDKNTAEYKLHNAYPTAISPMQIDYSSRGTLLEFTVTFAYSHFTTQVVTAESGNFVDTLIGKASEFSQNAITGALNTVGSSINDFIKDATGNSVNQLDAWAKGISTDFVSGGSSSINPGKTTGLRERDLPGSINDL